MSNAAGNQRKQQLFIPACLLGLAVLLSVVQNLKLVPTANGFDSLFRSGLRGYGWLAFATLASFATALGVQKVMNRGVTIMLTMLVAVCCLIAHWPVVGVIYGLMIGLCVTSKEARGVFVWFAIIWLPLIAFGTGLACVWRELDTPWRYLGPLLGVGVSIAIYRHQARKRMDASSARLLAWFRPATLFSSLLCVFGIWLGLTVDTARRMHLQNVDLVSSAGRLASQGFLEVTGVFIHDIEDNDLRGFRHLSSMRYLGIDRSPSFRGEGLRYVPDSVFYVSIEKSRLDPDGFEYLGQIPNLRWVWLSGTQFQSGAFSKLSGLTKISSLNLADTSTSDSDLADIAKLNSLLKIDLSGTPVTDAGLKAFADHPGLHAVDLSKTDVSGTCIPDLVQGQLEFDLRMVDAGVTDSSLEHFKKLKQVPTLMLDLSDNEIGDAGLEFIGMLSNLTTLKLSGTNVSDEGLEMLKGLKSLRDLDLLDTQCTGTGIYELEKALPAVDIEGNFVTP